MGLILDDELLLSEDETENPPPAKIVATEVEETKPLPAKALSPEKSTEKTHQSEKQQPMQKPNRKKQMNRNNPNNRPVRQQSHNQQNQYHDDLEAPQNDLFLRKRNFVESDSGFDRMNRLDNDQGGFSNPPPFERNFSNNNREFGDEFSRRPNKNTNTGNGNFSSVFGNRPNNDSNNSGNRTFGRRF